MILVADGFNLGKTQPGIETTIDDDRKVQLFHDGSCYLLCVFNGSRETRLSLTEEAALGVLALLEKAFTTSDLQSIALNLIAEKKP